VTQDSPASAATRAMRDAIVDAAPAPVVFDYVGARGPEGIRFDVWYGGEHLPALAETFRGAILRRYAAPARAAYLAIGEIDGARAATAVASAPELPAMVAHAERFVGEPLATKRRRDARDDVIESAIVYPAFLRVPHERMDEVGRWYDEEHLPMLMDCPEWAMVRRFRIAPGQGLDWTHVALHYLADIRALRSPQRDAARATPWRDALIAQGWFAPQYRVCYRIRDV
jgi:hypothetical protein